MPKSKKNTIKKNKTNRKSIGKTKKCIYTDEAKRIMKLIKELRKKNKTRKNK